jgi:hypothetical protein
MAYDPYGGQTPEQQLNTGDVIKDSLLYPLKVNSYFEMAKVTPLLYSPTKGIRLPYLKLIKDMKKANILGSIAPKTSLAGLTYSKLTVGQKFGNFRKAISPFAKRAFKSSFTLGLTESEHVGGSLVNAKIVEGRWQTATQKSIFNKIMTMGSVPKDRAEQLSAKLAKEAVQKGKVGTFNPFARRVDALDIGMKGKWAATDTLSGVGQKIELGSLRMVKRAAFLGRTALRVAKVGSYVGAAMLAWDIASIVAAPLAQAGMNVINSAANAFQSRYMPEMGGQLQLSYLSQANATERQRSVQAISKAYINGRSAFGSEGSMMHS